MSISPNAATAAGRRDQVDAELAGVAHRQIEAAAEEVRGDREQVVADAEQRRRDGWRRRRASAAAGSPRARRGRRRPSASQSTSRGWKCSDQPRSRQTSSEPEREQHLLPGGDDIERVAAHAGGVELGHREVVQREPDDEDVEDPDVALHSGPAATSVIPRLTILTG